MTLIQRYRQMFEKEVKAKYALSLFVMFICLIGFISALRFGGASLDFYSVRNAVEGWQQSGTIETREEFLRAQSSSELAAYVHHNHPLYQDLKGQVIEWGVVAGYIEKSELASAREAYHKATQLRPTWPVTWASLAMIKWRQQEFDDELRAYLEKANTLGPMQPEVHRLFSELGLSLYNANHAFFREIRPIVIERLSLGLKNSTSRKQINDFIQMSGSKRTVCRWLSDETIYIRKDVLKCDSTHP